MMERRDPAPVKSLIGLCTTGPATHCIYPNSLTVPLSSPKLYKAKRYFPMETSELDLRKIYSICN